MIRQILITIIITTGMAIIQSVFLVDIIPFGIVPDIAMILLVSFSWQYGSMIGVISGFFIGLGIDTMSISPLGFHSFLFSVIGYLFGRLHDTIAPSSWILIGLAALAASFVKYFGAYLLSLIFGLNSSGARYFTWVTLIACGTNMFLAPSFFRLSRLLAKLLDGKKGGFQ